MATLYFSGDQVAFFGSLNDTGTASEFGMVNAPFLATDIVEIVVPDQYIGPNGEFDPNEVQFTSVTVIRDGVRYEFDVNSGSKIKETGGSEIKEAGDSFFTTVDSVGPPSSGPFAGLSTEKMVFSTDTTFVTGQTTTIDRTVGRDLNGDGDTTDPGEQDNAQFNASQSRTPPCYAPGTLILTPEGPRMVEMLRPGDLVCTRDHGPQPILWAHRGDQPLEAVGREKRPVMISAGALGPNLPDRNLIVSPQHRLLFGGGGQLDGAFPFEALAPAKALTRLPGIRHMMGRDRITWVHFACAHHEIVQANGCWSESLLLGPVALQSLPEDQRQALFGLFGHDAASGALNGPPARTCLTVGEVHRMLVGPCGRNRIAA